MAKLKLPDVFDDVDDELAKTKSPTTITSHPSTATTTCLLYVVGIGTFSWLCTVLLFFVKKIFKLHIHRRTL